MINDLVIDKKFYLKSVPVLIMIMLCLGLISCSKRDDLSLIKNNTCAPPCWNGISPGSTNGEGVLNKLTNLKVVKQETVKRAWASHLLFKDVIYWDFVETGSGWIHLSDDKVAQIEFLTTNYSLSSLFELFGDPDQVVFYPYHGKLWEVNVLYKNKGIWFYYIKKQDKDWVVDVQPTDQVTRVSFVDPSKFDSILSHYGALFLKDGSLKFKDVQQPWKGYGEMQIVLGK